ncbi:GNAT family N-acetyltransferase [Sphingomonas daechungensis]|uniref:GNAT family N-acetyltransferase n=1 Tax=Sphingomonas daechungensis TaxID=1176646 RepID=UPI0031F1C0BC
MEFRTKRLTLRPARESDLVAMHGILSDPRAMTYWSSLPHDRIEQTWDWLASMLAIPPSEGEDFVVELGGKLIGKAGLWRFPEIGFIFHPDYWGRGYAREALEFVLDRAFGVHQLPAVTADVDPRNEGSIRLLAGLGFQETGREERTFQIGDQWCDSVYFELDAENWAKRK